MSGSLTPIINSFLPGSLIGFLLELAVGIAMLYGRESVRRWGRRWLIAIIGIHFVLSTSIGADGFRSPLTRHDDFLKDAAAARGATAVVLLTPTTVTYRARGFELREVQDFEALRIVEAGRVYHLLGDPLVVVQGGNPTLPGPAIGAIAKEKLISLGVPASRIVIEGESRNTRDHVERLRPILETHGVRTFVLVTSAEHMWRACATFRKAGFDFVPSASARQSELAVPQERLKPSATNLRSVLAASHEYAGLFYYWMRGWV